MKGRSADIVLCGVALPEVLQVSFALVLVATLFYFGIFREPSLDMSKEMAAQAARMRSGGIEERSAAVWTIQKADPVKAAATVPTLIELLSDATPVSERIRDEHFAAQQQLAGMFSGFLKPGDVRVGDIATWSIRRIRSGLVVECAGDGGPTSTLRAVRAVIRKEFLAAFPTAAKPLQKRWLQTLLGDTDPFAIDTVAAYGLSAPDPEVRAYSAALFITYGHSSRKKCLAAAPALAALLADADIAVQRTAAGALKAISGQDFGQDKDKWEGWLRGHAGMKQ